MSPSLQITFAVLHKIINVKSNCLLCCSYIRPPRAPWGPLDSGLNPESGAFTFLFFKGT